jgi:hypothetical protein
MNDQLSRGKAMLEEVALRYAGQHGLRPERVEWATQGYDWWLQVSTADHSVRVVFSPDEIEAFAGDDPGNKYAKMKIRNAFASLAM